MYINFVRKNTVLVSILFFLTIFMFIYTIKPAFFFNNDGSIREFGIGYKNKTIFPIWLFSVILGILSYIIVLFYLCYPRIYFS